MERRGSLLLVEDEAVLRTLVAQFLRTADYRVIEAGNGQEGVDRFFDSGPFDLALVDLNLPIFSGVEVCRRILSERPDQRIMICSAAIMPECEVALIGLGVDHFLTKPYHPEVLVAHIENELQRSTDRRAAASIYASSKSA
jgi:DNA-binding response OmpR family regulator